MGSSTPVVLPGKFHEQKSLAGYSPWGRKESDTTEHSTGIGHTQKQRILHLTAVSLPSSSSKHQVMVSFTVFLPASTEKCFCSLIEHLWFINIMLGSGESSKKPDRGCFCAPVPPSELTFSGLRGRVLSSALPRFSTLLFCSSLHPCDG